MLSTLLMYLYYISNVIQAKEVDLIPQGTCVGTDAKRFLRKNPKISSETTS